MNAFNLDGYYRIDTTSINIYFDRLWFRCRFCVIQIRSTKVEQTPKTKDGNQKISSIGDLDESKASKTSFGRFERGG